MEQIRVLIADDHEMVRDSIRRWLEAHEEIIVLGEIERGRDVVAAVIEHAPTVLLLDLHFPDMSGLDIIRELKRTDSETSILIMTGYEGQQVRAAMEAGASGFIVKDERRERIIEAVRWAASGQAGRWLSHSVIEDFMHSKDAMERAGLTHAEVKVLMLIEHSNQDIAKKLFLSEGTVKNQLTRIYSKIGVGSRMEAAAWARKHGLIEDRP